MGFWNSGIRSSSPSRSPSRSHNNNHNKTYYASRPSYSRSASSFFSISGLTGGGGGRGTSRARSSYSSSSHSSRARPRNGFIAKLRKFLRDLYYYMRRHPVKVFMLVIMPLLTGGALTKILSQFGVRLPRALERMAGSSAYRGVGQSDRYFSRGGARDFGGGSSLPGMMGGGGMGESVQGLMRVARMFM